MVYKNVAILVVLVVLVHGSIPIDSNEEYPIDPVSFEKLLDDTLATIIDEEYGEAYQLIELALNVTISDTTIQNLHDRLYKTLHDINELLNQTLFLEQHVHNMSSSEAKALIQRIYSRLYGKASDLRDIVQSYIGALNKYVKDRSTFLLYRLSIEKKLELLETRINDVLGELERLYSVVDRNLLKGWIDIFVDMPEKIYAGDRVQVDITLIPVINGTIPYQYTYNASLTLMVNIGNYLGVINKSYIRIPSTIHYVINIPGAREILRNRIEIIKEDSSTYYVPAKIVLKVQAIGENTVLRGFEVVNTKVYMLRPKITFHVPLHVYVNDTLTINAVASIDTPLDVAIYIDKIGNEANLLNVTIFPGTNFISIKLSNLSAGYHTVIFVSSPKGKYLPEKWTSTLAVVYTNLDIALDVPRIVVGTSFLLNIRGYVRNPCNYTLIVRVDDVEVYNETLYNETFSLVVEPPFTITSLFIWFKKLDIDVIPHNSSYTPSRYSFNILFVNTIFMSLLVILTGVIYMHPLVSSFMFSMFYRVRRLIIEEEYRRRREMEIMSRTEKPVGLRIEFRRFRFRRYYQSLITMLSRIAEPPGEAETLREYLRRIQEKLPDPVYLLVKELFMFFELDLYSKVRLGFDEFRKTYELLKKLMRHEA